MILCGSHVGFQLIPVGPDGSIHGCKPFCVPIFFFHLQYSKTKSSYHLD